MLRSDIGRCIKHLLRSRICIQPAVRTATYYRQPQKTKADVGLPKHHPDCESRRFTLSLFFTRIRRIPNFGITLHGGGPAAFGRTPTKRRGNSAPRGSLVCPSPLTHFSRPSCGEACTRLSVAPSSAVAPQLSGPCEAGWQKTERVNVTGALRSVFFG
ncbi:hypothetical protein QR680_012604 [Steinernema hermaphroditum]|uniref:Uncharacterized protein n=1 Tax=Steinernema hermaphroditum TaxID=289476 RepID=A0AA39M0T2_9BILA|nr:hypothetical protein QR680_012604 [Steinernema hermaphroditum]